MLRKSFLSLLIVLAVAVSSQAGVLLSLDAGTVTPGLTGFTTFVVTATSDVPGETIAGFDFIGDPAAPVDPLTSRGFFGAMNQEVLFGGALSTVFQDNNAVLDQQVGQNHAKDSQFLYATNAPTGGIQSPAGFFRETATSLQALWSRDTGFGEVAQIAQLVLPDSAAGKVDYRGVIAVSRGGSIVDLPEINGCVGNDCEGGGELPVALDGGPIVRIQGGVVNHTFTTSAGDLPITWSNLVAAGPGGATPTNAPVLNADGTFSWTSNQTGALGIWTFDATATNAAGSDVGRLTVELIVPEPATLSLLGLAMIGLVGFARRRG